MPKPKHATYDVHPSVATLEIWVKNLPRSTGKTLAQWVALTVKSGPTDLKGRKEWLKKEHGFASDAAAWLAACAGGEGFDFDAKEYLKTAREYVDGMYAGAKAELLPLHEALIALGRKVAKDIRVCPCKTIVPFYRNHVIAQIKPSTRTRIDFGFALKGQKTPAYLIDTGGAAKGDRITHRIEISSLEDIDDRVETWLKKAYTLDAD